MRTLGRITGFVKPILSLFLVIFALCSYSIVGSDVNPSENAVSVVLIPAADCECPAKFESVISEDLDYVGLSWILGAGNETTGAHIRVKYDAYPVDVEDGYEIYEGNETTFNHAIPVDKLLAEPKYAAFGTCNSGGEQYTTVDFVITAPRGLPMYVIAMLILPVGLAALYWLGKKNTIVGVICMLACFVIAPVIADYGMYYAIPIFVLGVGALLSVVYDSVSNRRLNL